MSDREDTSRVKERSAPPPAARSAPVTANRPGSRVRSALKILLVVGPAIWLAWSVDIGGVARHLSTVAFRPLVAAGGVTALGLAVSVLRWRLLLRAWGDGPVPSLLTLARDTLVGLYVNLLPTVVGGDVVRAWRSRGVTGGMTGALLVILVDRLCGLLGLLLLISVAGALGADSPDPRVTLANRTAWLAATLLTGVVGAAPWMIGRFPSIRRLLERGPRPLPGFAALRPPSSLWRVILGVLLSVVTQGSVVCALILVVSAVHPPLPARALLPVAPWIVLLIFFPLTPGGFGQRELVFVELLSLVGVPRDAALGASVLFFLVALFFAALGGVVLLTERRRTRRT